MKITIDVPDITLAAKALNNATATLGWFTWGALMGCDIPDRFHKMRDLDENELKKRVEIMKSIVAQVEAIENKFNIKRIVPNIIFKTINCDGNEFTYRYTDMDAFLKEWNAEDHMPNIPMLDDQLIYAEVDGLRLNCFTVANALAVMEKMYGMRF